MEHHHVDYVAEPAKRLGFFDMSQTLLDPAQKEIETQLGRLRTWCAQARGRRSAAARSLGVEPSRVTEWLGGYKIPTLTQFLRLKAFLDREHRKKEMKT